MPHISYIIFTFALGACIGSFLNVLVWRLPRIESPDRAPWYRRMWAVGKGISHPPSYCPNCEKPLKWYDNLPIVGWIKLGGKCRYCREPISKRYPIVELITALLFVLYYIMYYMLGIGPAAPIPHLFFGTEGIPLYYPPEIPIFLLHLFLVASLLAASLIDAELFQIPSSITWSTAVIAILAHALFDDPHTAGSLNLVMADGHPSPAAALGAGGTVGLVISLLLLKTGWLPYGFAFGEPLLEVEYAEREAENQRLKREKKQELPIPPRFTRWRITVEMGKEFLFLLPPIVLGIAWWFATLRFPEIRKEWASFARHDWVSGLLGSLFGAMIGGFVVWMTRILGTIGFGRLAMGLGDVDLMFAVGAVVGAGAATVAFFIAPFFGMAMAIYLLIFDRRRELPYGPYLALASAAVMLCYSPIAAWLEPGLLGLGMLVRQWAGLE